MEVAVVASVDALEAAQVGSGLVRRDGAFPVAGDGCCVVVEGGQSAFSQVEGDVGDVGLGQDSRLLQVAVGDVSVRVVERHETLLDVCREGGTPKAWCKALSKEYSTHSGLGGIHGSDYGRVVRDNFGETCGSFGDTERQALEVTEVVAKVGRDADTVCVGQLEAELHGAKEPGRTRYCCSHKAELPQYALPLLDAHASLVAKVLEDVRDPCFASVGEF
jgi:hypothetical protein